jgi:hypothetical protein
MTMVIPMLMPTGRSSLLLLALCVCTFAPFTRAASSWFSGSNDEKASKTNKQAKNDLVSPIVNRELEASVVAHDWPFIVDNVYCEAWGYHHQKDWDYMDRFVELMGAAGGDRTVAEATRIALEATQPSNKRALLQYSLSLRAHSPLCEMHRTLARQIVLNHPSASAALVEADAFAVLPDGSVATTPGELIELLSTISAPESSSRDTEDDDEPSLLLPDEVARGENGPLVVIYANMGSPAFVELYKPLVEKDDVTFVVRHRGHVTYEEVGGNATVLQGYGVRLDIKNVEYKVFDDEPDGSETESLLVNVSALEALSPHHTLAGIQPSALKDLSEADAIKLQQELWKVHEAQQVHSQLVPPKWQRRQLALQAATVISQTENDVLLTLQDISQNLPSVASTLVHVPVPEELVKLADLMEPIMQQTKGVALTINGRKVPVGRPSFNVFELLELLQEEQALLENMQAKLGPYLSLKGLKQVQKAWGLGQEYFLETYGEDAPSASTGMTGGGDEEDSASLSGNVRRIDVARGWKGAVIYVNDIEKDDQYRQWPRSVQQALMSMQFGSPPSVRRNLFTMLNVIDPAQEEAIQHLGFQLGAQLEQAQYPARLGFLIVNDKDLAECRKWIESDGITDDTIPCPTKPILTGKKKTLADLHKVPGTTQAVHRIIAMVAAEHAGDGLPSAFVQYFVQGLSKFVDDDGLTMGHVISEFAQIWQQFTSMSPKEASNLALDTLYEDEDADCLSSYGKSLRFALNKAIAPGMGFVNGRPLPIGASADPGKIFMEEQNHIFGLIMRSEITDRSPKSVYGKLLKGDGVFKRLHPLLTDSGNDPHVNVDVGFSTDALLFPKSHTFERPPSAVFVVEAVVDLETPEGVASATRFVEVMDAYADAITEGDSSLQLSIGYRIIPRSNLGTSPVCSIMANAGVIGADSLKNVLAQDGLTTKSMDELLALIPGLNAKQKVTISSFACSASVSSELMPRTNFVAVNGKVYSPEQGLIAKDDIELLVDIELSRSKATTKLLSNQVSFDDKNYHDAISKASIFLVGGDETDKSSSRMDMVHLVIEMEQDEEIENNPFRFSWNIEDQDELRIEASVALDPATEAAQRVAPFLLAFRDVLKLPLQMVLVPKPLMSGDDKSVPITSYYRFVADPTALPDVKPPKASFSNLPTNHILTLQLDVPESWNIQQTQTVQDTDNLRCDVKAGCSDEAHAGKVDPVVPMHERRQLTAVEYGMKNLLMFGQCYDYQTQSPPNGLQLALTQKGSPGNGKSSMAEISSDGSVDVSATSPADAVYSDTLVMKNVGYWQLRANPGLWELKIAPESRGAEIFDIVDGTVKRGKMKLSKNQVSNSTKTIVMKDFTGSGQVLIVKRRPGYEKATLFYDKDKGVKSGDDDVIHVFSLATGHLYERFLKIMMLSVTKRTSSKVKFWLFENFLSPSFKGSAKAMAEKIGCEVEFVTYKWPEWLRGQSEKQRIIWGYKILFLDVLFPLNVKKIIYVDADQVVRGDLKELWDMDLQGAPYGYTPFCTSRETTLGFQFWRSGFWETHLQGKPYHISALYVVDLEKFRKDLVGDQLRSIYQQLSADPNSLSNLDQDLPNYAQHQVPIFSLPQEWLWCESWCSDETKAASKTIDLCNNPLHKEPKVSMAKRVISGDLFEESWVDLDAEVEGHEKEYLSATLQMDYMFLHKQ